MNDNCELQLWALRTDTMSTTEYRQFRRPNTGNFDDRIQFRRRYTITMSTHVYFILCFYPQMLAGIVMNILAVPLLVLATGTWGDAMFDFENIPSAFLNSTSAVGSAWWTDGCFGRCLHLYVNSHKQLNEWCLWPPDYICLMSLSVFLHPLMVWTTFVRDFICQKLSLFWWRHVVLWLYDCPCHHISSSGNVLIDVIIFILERSRHLTQCIYYTQFYSQKLNSLSLSVPCVYVCVCVCLCVFVCVCVCVCVCVSLDTLPVARVSFNLLLMFI